MARQANHKKRTRDLCMSCRLPDCDIFNRGCLLHKAANDLSRLRRQKKTITPLTRSAAMEWHRLWKIERRADLSEARA